MQKNNGTTIVFPFFGFVASLVAPASTYFILETNPPHEAKACKMTAQPSPSSQLDLRTISVRVYEEITTQSILLCYRGIPMVLSHTYLGMIDLE